jgi:hypothetical protein
MCTVTMTRTMPYVFDKEGEDTGKSDVQLAGHGCGGCHGCGCVTFWWGGCGGCGGDCD